MQLSALAGDAPGEHSHQLTHLAGGASPVLGREHVDGELLDAELERVLHTRPEGVSGGSVACTGRESMLPRPAVVAVGDDGHIAREAYESSSASAGGTRDASQPGVATSASASTSTSTKISSGRAPVAMRASGKPVMCLR